MTKYLNLKLLRQSLGLSQVQLSTEIGLAQGYISELEKGKKQITDEVISKLYDRYGHDVVDEWMQEPPVVQQTVEREINNFSGTGDVSVQSGNSIPMEAFNKMLDELAEQRKIVTKSQEQIDRLLGLLEKK
ncbi:helix-turn-helix domain-containing protein [Duncaniella muris]|jgi:Predicted transcriptional regulator with C-terminal CBS domains|uniref:helix-turn-helix domain-containing protein n=1 Tax=Duncaniella muris TaxID=2094150 RepID=UPI0025B33827|nr:helix-turn-helix domain-containing protein [Duncaniella muris]